MRGEMRRSPQERRRRFRFVESFVGVDGKTYYEWERPIDSRVEQITVSREFFWGAS